MSSNEDTKTQEHRKQQVEMSGAGFTGAYNEGILYQSWSLMHLGLMTYGASWIPIRYS
jgi:hypothetical protein